MSYSYSHEDKIVASAAHRDDYEGLKFDELNSKIAVRTIGTNTNGSSDVNISDPVTGDSALVNTSGQLHTVLRGTTDTGNSTEAPLLADAVFNGTSIDTLDYSAVSIVLYSDVASATNGLMVQYSADGSDWYDGESYSIIAGATKFFTPTLQAQYMRVVYTNGATNQTIFHMHTTLRKSPIKWSSHNIADPIKDEDDAELIKAVITGKDTDGVFQNVSTTVDGDLTISDNSSGLAIAKGEVSGSTFIHKFGSSPKFDKTDGFVTVWDGADDGDPYEKSVYTYSTTADIDTLSSDDAGDTQLAEVQGLDENYDLVIQSKQLDGLNKVVLDTPLLRVFRVKNISSVDFAGHVFVSVDGTLTAGVPTPANLRAVVHNENNQTEMAVFTIPNGKTGYLRDWYASTAGAKKDSSHVIRLIARPFGQVFQLKHKASIVESGTSYIKHNYEEPEVLAEKTDVEIRMNTDQDDASVAAGFDIVLVDN